VIIPSHLIIEKYRNQVLAYYSFLWTCKENNAPGTMPIDWQNFRDYEHLLTLKNELVRTEGFLEIPQDFIYEVDRWASEQVFRKSFGDTPQVIIEPLMKSAS
jgi:hypothetical protein